MKIIVMQCGWIAYELGSAHESEVLNLAQTLYIHFPEATIYLDRGRGWEFVNRHAHWKCATGEAMSSHGTSPPGG